MRQLRLPESSMAISLASLHGYHNGPQGFMRQLRLARSFMGMFLACFDVYHDGSQGFMKQLRLARSFVEIFLACFDGYHGVVTSNWSRCASRAKFVCTNIKTAVEDTRPWPHHKKAPKPFETQIKYPERILSFPGCFFFLWF